MTASSADTDIVIDVRDGRTRAAVLRDGGLTDLHVDHDRVPLLQGGVFLATAVHVSASLDAAFIDLGTGREGFLPASDFRGGSGGKSAPLTKVLRPGRPIIVQVKAERGGEKGPTVTMDVTLPGRFVVYAPLGKGLALSRRLADAGARARLKDLLGHMVGAGGWIVRRDAADADPERILAEADALVGQWREAEHASSRAAPPKRLIAPPDAPRRAIIEQGGRAIRSILVEDAGLAASLRSWLTDRAPDLAHRVAVHDDRLPVFEALGLEETFERLLRRRVDLPGGGSLIIDRTAAMTVIDVNAGDQGNLLAVNLEAAAEIARQIRLRNIGGIIVVDFINLASRGARERVLDALSRAVADDPAATHVYGMSKLGLVEMTRAHRGADLAALTAAERDPEV